MFLKEIRDGIWILKKKKKKKKQILIYSCIGSPTWNRRSGNVPAGEKDRLSKAWFLAVLMLPTWIATHRESKKKIFYFLPFFSIARIFSVPLSTTRSSFTLLAIDSNRYFHSYEKDETFVPLPSRLSFVFFFFTHLLAFSRATFIPACWQIQLYERESVKVPHVAWRESERCKKQMERTSIHGVIAHLDQLMFMLKYVS